MDKQRNARVHETKHVGLKSGVTVFIPLEKQIGQPAEPLQNVTKGNSSISKPLDAKENDKEEAANCL
jgi:hypothetical protein